MNEADLLLVANFSERASRGVVYPTDGEVLAHVRLFAFFMLAGSKLHQEMMNIWAVMNYQSWVGIARARGLNVDE